MRIMVRYSVSAGFAILRRSVSLCTVIITGITTDERYAHKVITGSLSMYR